jgi:hypothetical protein
MNSYKQVRTQRVARWCNAPTANLDAPSGNLQNIEDKYADQPAKTRATQYRIHVLPLLNRCAWKNIIFKIGPKTSVLFRCIYPL